MAIRIPVVINSITDVTAAAGTTNTNITIPQDVDNITVKLYSAGLTGSGAVCDLYVQTTDDGGTTWYDCAHFTQLTTAAVTAANAQWTTIPVASTAVTGLGSGYTGSVAAGTYTVSKNSGLPILSQLVRLSFVYGGSLSANAGVTVKVYGSQSTHQ